MTVGPETDDDFVRLLRLVARVCQAPVAVVTLPETTRHRVAAVWGVSLPDPQRLAAFGPNTSMLDGLVEVPDTTLNAHFDRLTLVVEEPYIRFYAGRRLVTQDGDVIGTLGVMDQVPRRLTAIQAEGLETLAAQIVLQLELRRHRRVISGMTAERERMNAMLQRHTNESLQKAGPSAQLGRWVVELPSRRILWSDEVAAIYEQAAGALYELEETFAHCVPEGRAKFMKVFDSCIRDGTPFDEETEIITAKGRRLWVRTIGHAVRNSQGELVGVQGVTQDISERKKAELDAKRVSARLARTLENITDAFFTLDTDWRFTYLNQHSERLLGRRRDELLGQPVWAEFRRTVEFARNFSDGAVPDESPPVEFDRFYALTQLWFEIRAYSTEDGWAVYMRDITGRRQSEEQLRLLELSVSRLNDLVLITIAGPGGPRDQQLVFVNDAFVRHTGFSREEVMGQSPRLLQGPKTQRSELDRIAAALESDQPVRAELINYRKHGEEFWIELDMVPVADVRGKVSHWVAVGRDITQRRAVVAEIQHLAFVDPLTQLPNRLVLLDRLEAALRHSAADGEFGALMFIDLDNFKTLNDTLGHDMGDLLLQQVARRLVQSVREADTVARLGGDEFVVMLEKLGRDEESAARGSSVAAAKVLAALGRPYTLHGSEHYSSCSIGVTPFGGQPQSVSDLLKQADLAMYQAKSAGRDRVSFFNPQMQAAATANAALTTDLRQALRDMQFVLHYQPQVDRDGSMSGVEALVRWQHPQRGLVGPSDFIPAAEESGLILPLGHWVIETACNQLALWALRPETARLSIAVNVSVKQFRHPEFVELVVQAIEHSGISPYRLKLELTETLLAEGMEVTIAKMGTLKNMGVTLALDDFGMGYSALSSLKRIPLDQLKIDKTFVRDILFDPNDAAIARAIIAMAQSLGLGVMAEGVETEAQRAFLARQGCHCYQGFLFCEPLPIEELEAFMLKLAA